MHRDDDHVGAGRARLGDRVAHRGHDVARRRRGRAGCRGPRPSSPASSRRRCRPHAAALDDRPRRGRRALPSARYALAARNGNARLRDRARSSERHAVVELVVADRGRVVAHGVHRGDDRVRRAVGVDARRDEVERVALQQVAGVHEHDAARCARAQRVDDRGGAGEPARRVGGVRRSSPSRAAGRGRRSSPRRRGRPSAGRGRRRRGATRGGRAAAPTRRARERRTTVRSAWEEASRRACGSAGSVALPVDDLLAPRTHLARHARRADTRP